MLHGLVLVVGERRDVPIRERGAGLGSLVEHRRDARRGGLGSPGRPDPHEGVDRLPVGEHVACQQLAREPVRVFGRLVLRVDRVRVVQLVGRRMVKRKRLRQAGQGGGYADGELAWPWIFGATGDESGASFALAWTSRTTRVEVPKIFS